MNYNKSAGGLSFALFARTDYLNRQKQGMCFFLKFDHLRETKDLAAKVEHLAPSSFERLDENKGLSRPNANFQTCSIERLKENKLLSHEI